jgi:S1-C subfamily serine protease
MPRTPRGQPNQQTPGGRAPRGGFGQILPDGVDAGILIMNVTANSPAAAAGLTSRDLIVAVDGNAPASVQAFVDAVGAKKAGDKITLKVYNPADQTSKDITVTLAENPSAKGKAYMGVTLNGRMIERSTTQPQGTGA